MIICNSVEAAAVLGLCPTNSARAVVGRGGFNDCNNSWFRCRRPSALRLRIKPGPRAGAVAYNVAHTTALALPLALAGLLAGEPAVLAVALIWIAHIGFDRALGYGLKYPSKFGDTHLGRIGRR